VFADNAKISDISENATDVYARTEKLENGTKLIVAFDLGGAFLTSSMHPAQYKVAEKMIREFAIKAATEAVDDKLKEQEKKFREADENLKDLVKENEKLKSNIESYKKKIEEAEADLKKNGENQVTAKSAVEAQQKVVDQWKDKKKSIE
jgi:chromosome segregation ATPase